MQSPAPVYVMFIVIIGTLIWDYDFNYPKHIAHENEKEERTFTFYMHIFFSVAVEPLFPRRNSWILDSFIHPLILNLQFPQQIWNLCQCIHETFPMIKLDRHWTQTPPLFYHPEIWLDFGSSDLQIQDLRFW